MFFLKKVGIGCSRFSLCLGSKNGSFEFNDLINIATSNNQDYISSAQKHDVIDRIDNKEIFSLSLAKEFTGNNEELAIELFDMLRAELSEYVDAITLAVKDNNLIDLREQVHKLHGASRCCGTSELKQVSSYIENLIDQNIAFDLDRETSKLLDAIQKVTDYTLDKES